MGKTSIEWTEQTWNPVRGCSRISPGCQQCYAERMAARNLPGLRSTTGEPFAIMTDSGPRWTGKVKLIQHMLDVPLQRKKPTMWFVNSMSDLFHEDLPDADIDRVFAVMALCPQHIFQVLTKRADRMAAWSSLPRRAHRGDWWDETRRKIDSGPHLQWPLQNVWLGVSVEDQQRADGRIPHLLVTPAEVRFLSVEPLLGPVDLKLCDHPQFPAYGECRPHIDWVIAGGESGPGARPIHPDWARGIRDQCVAASVPFFFKQWGEFAPVNEGAVKGKHYYFPDGETVCRVGKKAAGRLLDGRDWNDLPGGRPCIRLPSTS